MATPVGVAYLRDVAHGVVDEHAVVYVVGERTRSCKLSAGHAWVACACVVTRGAVHAVDGSRCLRRGPCSSVSWVPSADRSAEGERDGGREGAEGTAIEGLLFSGFGVMSERERARAAVV